MLPADSLEHRIEVLMKSYNVTKIIEQETAVYPYSYRLNIKKDYDFTSELVSVLNSVCGKNNYLIMQNRIETSVYLREADVQFVVLSLND